MSGLRLGIIGLASSHVPQWIRYVTQPNVGDHPLLRDCTVTALGLMGSTYGDAIDRSRIHVLQHSLRHPPLASVGPPSLVALDMVGKVDAIIVADRHHASHYEHSLPFIRFGVPVFIDKPMVSTLDEAESLLTQTHSTGAVQSYSAMRFDPRVIAVAVDRRGHPSHITVSGGADPASPYGGAAFYGVHTIEIGLAIAPGKVLSWQVLPQAERGVHSFRVVSAEGSIRHVTDIDVHLDPHRQQEPFTITSAGSTVQIPVAGDYLLPGFIRWLRTLAGAAPALSVEAMTLTVALTETLPR